MCPRNKVLNTDSVHEGVFEFSPPAQECCHAHRLSRADQKLARGFVFIASRTLPNLLDQAEKGGSLLPVCGILQNWLPSFARGLGSRVRGVLSLEPT